MATILLIEDAQDLARAICRQLDRLGLGRELTEIPWGSKGFRLPPSGLAA